MSTHVVNVSAGDPNGHQQRLVLRAAKTLGLVTAATRVGTSVTLTFAAELSPGQVTLLGQIALATATDLVTAAEYVAIQPDIDLLVTFQGNAAPTNAQVVAAVKAQSRILKAILRS